MSRNDAAFDEFPDGLLTITPDGTVLPWNKAASEIFGYTKDETLGQRITDLIVPPERVDEAGRADIVAGFLGVR